MVESDENWATELRNRGVQNVTVVSDVDEVRSLLQNLYASGQRFGVVVVDGIEPRHSYLNDAGALVDESGVLVVDNSDRVAYQSALNGLEGFHRFDFFGMGPQNPYAWATSVFSRRGVFPEGRRESFSQRIRE